VLLAAGATVEVTSVRGPRQIPAAEFFLGPKRNVLAADELITSVLIPAAPGPQQFAKVGTRNAMVIAVCAFALELRPPGPRQGAQGASGYAGRAAPHGGWVPGGVVPPGGSTGTGIGSAGPTPLRAREAEEYLDGALAEAGLWESAGPLPEPVARRFGELVGAAARPIDDVRGTAAYRRHALSVLARRTLAWAWAAYRQDRQAGA
jgi:CO/xanthine dehydrogenase FAD-binding subunit